MARDQFYKSIRRLLFPNADLFLIINNSLLINASCYRKFLDFFELQKTDCSC